MATKIISGTQFSSLPASYIRKEWERPMLHQVGVFDNIPVIDLGCEDANLVVDQIGRACHEYGFFQVRYINRLILYDLTIDLKSSILFLLY